MSIKENYRVRSLILTITLIATIIFGFQNCSLENFQTIQNKTLGSNSTSTSQESIAKEKCNENSGEEKQNCLQVASFYNTYLKRDPSFIDLDQWTGIVTRGEATLSQVEATLASSVEAQNIQALSSTSRSIYWGAWIDGIPAAPGKAPQNRSEFEDMAGKAMSVTGAVSWWYPDQSWSDFNTLFIDPSIPERNWANQVHQNGTTPVLMWQPYNPNAPACHTPEFIDHIIKYSAKSIAQGIHDGYIHKWAQQIRAWGKPIYIRTMHELNFQRRINDPCTEYFTSWDADLMIKGRVINTPQDIIAAWRRIVSIFKTEDASNVKWIWSVLSAPSANFGGGNPVSLQSIYPGDDYVDWIGVECYNFTASDWESCSDRMRGIYNEAASLSPVVPILNVEMGAFEDSRKSAWMSEALSISNPNSMYNQFPRLNGFMYWNDSRYNGLWVKSSPASTQSFRSAISDSVYVSGHSHVEGEVLQPQPPIQIPSPAIEIIKDDEAREKIIALMKSPLGRSQEDIDEDPEGIQFWVNQMKQGMSEDAIKDHFLNSDEYFLRNAYVIYLKRPADKPGMNYYMEALRSKQMTRSQIVAFMDKVCTEHIGGECATGGPTPPTLSCSFNSSTIAPGNSVTAYLQASVPHGSECEEQTRTCNNGTLSGSYSYSLCTVESAPESEVDYEQVVLGAFVHILGRSYQEAIADTQGVSYWVNRLTSGYSIQAFTADLKASDEYFVRQSYKTILRRTPSVSEVNYYIGELKAGRRTRAWITQHFRYVCENKLGNECR